MDCRILETAPLKLHRLIVQVSTVVVNIPCYWESTPLFFDSRVSITVGNIPCYQENKILFCFSAASGVGSNVPCYRDKQIFLNLVFGCLPPLVMNPAARIGKTCRNDQNEGGSSFTVLLFS